MRRMERPRITRQVRRMESGAARINVNTWDPTHRLILNIEATAYHEGIPGHHQQIALAQEMTDLPEFRRNGGYNAFVEGWALYAERLGKEVGFYQDPYSEYGRLQNEDVARGAAGGRYRCAL